MLGFRPLSRYFPVDETTTEAWKYCNSTDRDEVNRIVSNIICGHRLEFSQGASSLHYSHRIIQGNAVKALQLRYGGKIKVRTKEASPLAIITMPLTGCFSYQCGKQTGLATTKRGFLPDINKSFEFDWETNCEILTLCIDRTAIKHRLSEILGRPLYQDIKFDIPVNTESNTGKQWLLAVRDFIEYIQLCDTNNNRLLPQYEKLLLSSLLYNQPHNYSGELLTADICTPKQIKMIENYLEENIMHDVFMQDLIDLTGLCERSIVQTFKKYRGCTPMQYIRLLRLRKAHSELLGAHPNTSVTEIAMKWGFFHLGRFSDFYKKHYNRSPSHTLKFKDFK